MRARTEGIRPTRPVRWRNLDGIVGVHWVAEGHSRAKGFYVSPDPRIVVFFNDVSAQIRMSNQPSGSPAEFRPMARAIYVPAGQPMWTDFTAAHSFSHLDLHLHRDRMLRFLAPSVGSSAAQAALRRPAEIEAAGAIETLARLLADELAAPVRHGVYAESLVGSIATAMLELPPEIDTGDGGLAPAEMEKLAAHLEEKGRLTVADMAAIVGLSADRFAQRFKQTAGQTPLQWQLASRIARAKTLLMRRELTVAAVASQLGFTDQAHFTRMFRQIAGETPAAWRQAQGAGRPPR